jgi:hypothetical protein
VVHGPDLPVASKKKPPWLQIVIFQYLYLTTCMSAVSLIMRELKVQKGR